MPARLSRLAAIALAALCCLFALQACGGTSEADKAKDDVCSARDDIRAQVDELKGISIGSATTDEIKASLRAIRTDLGKIQSARDKLDSDTRAQVDAANQAFASQLRTVAATVGTSQSLDSASAQLKQAFSDLAAAYEKAFDPIDCG